MANFALATNTFSEKAVYLWLLDTTVLHTVESDRFTEERSKQQPLITQPSDHTSSKPWSCMSLAKLLGRCIDKIDLLFMIEQLNSSCFQMVQLMGSIELKRAFYSATPSI